MPPAPARHQWLTPAWEGNSAHAECTARRIRELEHGLGAVYATISQEEHPLLSGEDTSTQGSSSMDVPMFATPPLYVEADPSVYRDDVINCFGTLSVPLRHRCL